MPRRVGLGCIRSVAEERTLKVLLFQTSRYIGGLKLKKFCPARETINQVKKKPEGKERIFASYAFN